MRFSNFKLLLALLACTSMVLLGHGYAHANDLKVVVIPMFDEGAAAKWRGSWAVDTDYEVGDIIEEDGSSYIAITNHRSSLGDIPPDGSFWNLVAASGANGLGGSDGDIGPKGDKGDPGTDGEAGAMGLKGDKGDPGSDGAAGAMGLKGDKGDPGSDGAAGAMGLKGDKGDPGTDGAAGAMGLKGDKGDPGEDGSNALVANVVWVAKTGGDYDTLSAALAAITGTSTDPYLIRIAPGVYTENDGVDLKSYVSIEGSGEGVTIIRGDGGEESPYSGGGSATVRAANITAELRHLTVESVATVYANSVAIRTSGATNALALKHITAIGSGGISQTHGVMNVASSPLLEGVYAQAAAMTGNSFAVFNFFNSSPMMRQVTAESTSGATSSGIRNQQNSNPIMIGVNASGTGGASNSYGLETYQDTAATVIIHDSTFAGTTNSIRNQTFYTMTPPMITLVSSRVDGPVGDFHTCHDSYTATGQALDSACRPIPCVGTYYIDRVNEIFYPGGGITLTIQYYDLWTFAQDGTFQATEAYAGGPPLISWGRQGAWSTKADGTVAATFLGLEEVGGEYNTVLRFDADVTFTADCSATQAVDLSLRRYDPASENPLDPTASEDVWEDGTITITGTLITTPQ